MKLINLRYRVYGPSELPKIGLNTEQLASFPDENGQSKGIIRKETLDQISKWAKKMGKANLKGSMVLDSGSTVFATNVRNNLLRLSPKVPGITVDTGNGECQTKEYGPTYIRFL